MGDWRFAGHAMRRRTGAPTNHLHSAGIGARVNLPTPEEALAGMARVGSPRVPMGDSAITDFANAKGVPPLKGGLIPKQGGQAGDPTPPTGAKSNVSQEALGASYRVKAVTPPMMSPEAGATTANGMIVPSNLNRQDAWGEGVQGAYEGH